MTRILLSILLPILGYAQSNVPFEKARAALASADFDEALKWFDLSEQDFPKSKTKTESIFEHAIILASKELAYTKLIKLWSEGAALEKVESDESKLKLEASYYEDVNKKNVTFLGQKAGSICKPQTDLSIAVSVPVFDDEIEKLRTRVKRGEWLPSDTRKKIEKEEWKLNYVGIMREIIGSIKEENGQFFFEGPVKWEFVSSTIGTRLAIAYDYYKDPLLRKAAVVCFKNAAALTASTPYTDLHQKAKEYLERLEKSKK